MYLAIDTCTETAGIALFDGERTVGESIWIAGRNQTSELTPSLGYLLEKHDVQKTDLKGIAVAKGPGSFNGIRVGMSVAKGLALTLNIDIISATSLEIHAFPYLNTGNDVCSVIEMGRGEIATVIFHQDHSIVNSGIEPELLSPDVLPDRISTPTNFCGTISSDMLNLIKSHLGDLALFPRGPLPYRNASDLAYIGYAKIKAGVTEDASSLAPIYVRKPPVGD